MARLRVEVVYACPESQQVVLVDLEEGARVADAVRESRLCILHPEIDPACSATGIFGRRAAPDTPLRDGDRVEIYRPLLIDPKTARRAKAAAKARHAPVRKRSTR
jgi:putative ubiquitin-RnfH superfamily antitoxin RatB of RatAB toxin-antitoxin module